jgi:hypothetical protein
MPVEYQIGILGKPDHKRDAVAQELHSQATALGIDPASISLIDEAGIRARNRKKPFIGIFFGYRGALNSAHPILEDLLQDSTVVIPLVDTIKEVAQFIPPILAHINCLESSASKPNIERIASLIFENFRLLRSERRLFISYRRLESQGVAIELYELLDSLGFDVFLDTRGVPPAADFQSVLWHRLADSDVVVLLDTPDFRASRWTVQELARANATSIQILHLLWPGVAADLYSAFSEFRELRPEDFKDGIVTGPDARLQSTVAATIGPAVESLRARAMAARYRYLVDNFCDQALALNQQATVQSTRFIALELTNGRRIAVVPAIGVPNARRFQDFEAAILANPTKFEKIWLLYDERGILQGWLDHIDWLNKHLPVMAVRVSTSGSRICVEAK